MTTTSILKPLAIQDIHDKQFFIPHYQRGYRWTKTQVKQLLDDIEQFTPTYLNARGALSFYCLQPVVVKAMDTAEKQLHNLEGEWYEVIDGQQRLTTIFLIIQGINEFWKGKKSSLSSNLLMKLEKKAQTF